MSEGKQHTVEVPARYGASNLTVTAWDADDSASITLWHHGVSASIQLTHEQLRQVRNACTEVLDAVWEGALAS